LKAATASAEHREPAIPSVITDMQETFAGIRSELPMADDALAKIQTLRISLIVYLDAIERLLAVDQLLRSGVEVDEVELAKVTAGLKEHVHGA
jgi:hypothetical protein